MPTHVTESTGASVTATWEFTTGTLQVSSTGTFKANTISESTSGSGVTIDSVLLKDGAITLGTGVSVPVASGGTGAITASAALTSLGAAASGRNADVTSLNGLTSPLSVAQGGTSLATVSSGGLVYGNGTGALQVLAAGTSSHQLTMNGSSVPVWVAPVEYVAVICNAPSTTNATTTDIARFEFPFSGYVQQAACGVSTAPTGTTFAVDVRNGTTSFFSTTMRMNPGETTSRTATTPTVINTATSNFNAWDTCRIHVDSDGITSKGLWVTLICVRTN